MLNPPATPYRTPTHQPNLDPIAVLEDAPLVPQRPAFRPWRLSSVRLYRDFLSMDGAGGQHDLGLAEFSYVKIAERSRPVFGLGLLPLLLLPLWRGYELFMIPVLLCATMSAAAFFLRKSVVVVVVDMIGREFSVKPRDAKDALRFAEAVRLAKREFTPDPIEPLVAAQEVLPPRPSTPAPPLPTTPIGSGPLNWGLIGVVAFLYASMAIPFFASGDAALVPKRAAIMVLIGVSLLVPFLAQLARRYW